MFSLRALLFVAFAFACVVAADERVKKQVLLGAAPYPYAAYSPAYPAAPLAYSAPAAIPAYGYNYPGFYSHGLYY